MYYERPSGLDDRDSPYGRQYRPRSRSQSRSREHGRGDWSSSRDLRSPPPLRRRSITPDNNWPLSRGEGGRYSRSRRSNSGSPLSRDDRDPRMGRSRSRSPLPPRKRRTPSPPPSTDGQRFKRENNYRPAYDSAPSREHGNVTRNWTRPPSWQGRGTNQQGHPQQAPYDYRQGPDSSNAPPQRTPPANAPPPPSGPHGDPTRPSPSTAATDPPAEPSVPTGPSAVPSGPASWRRAQQFNQRPDYRQNYSSNRGGGPPHMSPLQRSSPRQPPFQHQSGPSPAPSPRDIQGQSSPFVRSAIPTGPRAFTRPSENPVKKEYVSPVVDLNEKVLDFRLRSDCSFRN